MEDAAAAYAGRDDVLLLSFIVESMVEEADLKIKYEAAASAPGGTGAFANVYGGVIPYACLHAAPMLLKLVDGKLVIPGIGSNDGGGADTIGASVDMDSDVEDDGMEPFDQHRFDEDD